jgi:two-component system chemotaxis sensor kinase CheA
MGSDNPIDDFLTECSEILEDVKTNFRLLESNVSQKKEAPDLLNKLHRCFHSLKGLSGLFGFTEFSGLCSSLEILCNNLRIKALGLEMNIVRLIEEAVFALEKCLPTDGLNNVQPIANLYDLLERIKIVNDSCASIDNAQGLVVSVRFVFSEEVVRSLQEFEEARLIDCFKQNKKIYLIRMIYGIDDFDQIKELQDCLGQFGEVIALLTGQDSSDQGKIIFKILFATDLDFQLFTPVMQIQDTKADNSDVFEDNDMPDLPE